MARFVSGARAEDLTEETRRALKARVLDSVACAIGALAGPPVRAIHEQVIDFGGGRPCTLLAGGSAAPDRAALYNGAAIRYLDFNDSFLARKETCHPSDNIGAVLAAAEYAGASGVSFLTALATAYQVQCRLSEEAPVRDKGFDHTTQGAYASAAGVARALELDAERTAHALAISGTAFNALRVTRTGTISHWKGLAYPMVAFCGTHAAFLAMRGVTGPLEVIEGNKGFSDSIAGPFEVDWEHETLDRVNRTIIKKYNAEIHSQSAIEALIELKRKHGFDAGEVRAVDIEIFDVAHKIIGGGEEGEKKQIRTKEQADHSLPYLAAVALLDGEVTPRQYTDDRIGREDVQTLLQKVNVTPSEQFSERFPDEMPCRVMVQLDDGKRLEHERRDYEGFHTAPMNWRTLREKFDMLARPYTEKELRTSIAETIQHLDETDVKELTRLLARVQRPGSAGEQGGKTTNAIT